MMWRRCGDDVAMMFVGGSYASLTYFGTRPSDRAQIWLACADRYSHLKTNLTHPTPGGFRGLSIVKHLSRRTAPKFGTHVRIDTLTLKKKVDPPHHRGVWGLICLARLALARDRTPIIYISIALNIGQLNVGTKGLM